jgi:hypothetical protein
LRGFCWAVDLDTVVRRDSQNGIMPDQAGMELIIEWTPGTREFVTFTEGPAFHLQVLNATDEPIWLV